MPNEREQLAQLGRIKQYLLSEGSLDYVGFDCNLQSEYWEKCGRMEPKWSILPDCCDEYYFKINILRVAEKSPAVSV